MPQALAYAQDKFTFKVATDLHYNAGGVTITVIATRYI